MKPLHLALAWIVLMPVCGTARAEAGKGRAVRLFEQHITLSPKGDSVVRLRWTLPPREFAELRAKLGQAKVVERDGKKQIERQKPGIMNLASYLNLLDLWARPDRVRVRMDDARHQIRATLEIPGWATTTAASRWRVDVLDNARWYNLLDENSAPRTGTLEYVADKAAGKEVQRFVARTAVGDTDNVQSLEVRLPAGATGAQLVKRATGRWALAYSFKPPAARTGGEGEPVVYLEPRREIIPVLHKLYGDPAWATLAVAQLHFENTGRDRITNLRVRCRLATSLGRSNWGEWEEVAAVVHPGMRVQHAIHPVLDAQAVMLRSRENGKLFLEATYTQPGGKQVTRLLQGTLNVLGRNDIPFTLLDLRKIPDVSFHHTRQDAPLLLAAMVAPNDPVIKELKGKLAGFIGGLAVHENDEAALRYTKAIYDFFRCNIAYSSPTGAVSEDSKLVQHVNYARDVLKAGSGTCIDLAITFAALAEAGGLATGIVLVPGHAFAYTVLPQSGRPVFVETTCCRKGTLEGSAPFLEAVALGQKQADEHKEFVVVNLRRLRGVISEPELPGPATQNLLTAWGRRLPPPYQVVRFGVPGAVEHNVVLDGKAGLKLTVGASVEQSRGRTVELALGLAHGTERPIVVSMSQRPDKEHTGMKNYTFFFPYDRLSCPADGKWREFRLRGLGFSPVYREPADVHSAEEQFLMRRLPAGEGDTPTTHSLRLRSQWTAAPKAGLQLDVYDVQLSLKSGGVVVTLLDGERRPVKRPDGSAVTAQGKLSGRARLFLPAADLPAAAPGKPREFPLGLNLLDRPGGRQLLDEPCVIAIRP